MEGQRGDGEHLVFAYLFVHLGHKPEQDRNTAIRLAHEKGALFSYNHSEIERSVEPCHIPRDRLRRDWNSVSDYNHNFQATFKFWDDLLRRHEKRITARKAPGRLDSIRQGRVSLSANEDAPRLEIRADRDLIVRLRNATGGYDFVWFGCSGRFSDNSRRRWCLRVDDRRRTSVSRRHQCAAGDARKSIPSTLATITDKADSGHYLIVLIKNGLFFEAWLVRKKVREISLRTTVRASESSYHRAELYGDSPKARSDQSDLFQFCDRNRISTTLGDGKAHELIFELWLSRSSVDTLCEGEMWKRGASSVSRYAGVSSGLPARNRTSLAAGSAPQPPHPAAMNGDRLPSSPLRRRQLGREARCMLRLPTRLKPTTGRKRRWILRSRQPKLEPARFTRKASNGYKNSDYSGPGRPH